MVNKRQLLHFIVQFKIIFNTSTTSLNMQISCCAGIKQACESRVKQWWLGLSRRGYLWLPRPACLSPSHQNTKAACGAELLSVGSRPLLACPSSLCFIFSHPLGWKKSQPSPVIIYIFSVLILPRPSSQSLFFMYFMHMMGLLNFPLLLCIFFNPFLFPLFSRCPMISKSVVLSAVSNSSAIEIDVLISLEM